MSHFHKETKPDQLNLWTFTHYSINLCELFHTLQHGKKKTYIEIKQIWLLWTLILQVLHGFNKSPPSPSLELEWWLTFKCDFPLYFPLSKTWDITKSIMSLHIKLAKLAKRSLVMVKLLEEIEERHYFVDTTAICLSEDFRFIRISNSGTFASLTILI